MRAHNLLLPLALLWGCAESSPYSQQELADLRRIVKFQRENHAQKMNVAKSALDNYCDRTKRCQGKEFESYASAFRGDLVSSQSPFTGKSKMVLSRGVFVQSIQVGAKWEIYDGEFFYFHGDPAHKGSLPAMVFLGQRTIQGEDIDPPIGLYIAENNLELMNEPVNVYAFFEADQGYLQTFEQKHEQEVSAYKKELQRAAELSESSSALFSFGQSLVVGLGGRILATGNTTIDKLTKTGLKFAVDATVNGVDHATQTLLTEQKERLETAIRKVAEQQSKALLNKAMSR